ncbi:MAG: GxxExxY protein [Candidatus Cloacimonetes bacterium]|nr:GxxExxY protein [Candidatus Cloacimonadota bacterium]
MELIYKDLSYKIVGLAMQAHRELGPGFLEKVYENALMVLFRNEQIQAEQQSSIKVFFQNEIVGNYIADILVEDKIILELKTVDKITDVHKAQAINYLKATGLHLAMIFNFHSQSLEYERIVL